MTYVLVCSRSMPLKVEARPRFSKGWVDFARELELQAKLSVDGIGNGGGGASDGKIVNLMTEEDGFRAKLVGNVDIAFMGGILEVECRGGEDGIDVILPEAAALGWP